MMKLAELPRVKPGQAVRQLEKALGAVDRERLALGQKAETLLSYRVLKSDVTGSVATPVKDIGELGKALIVLEIEVLDAAHVVRYQHDMVRDLNQGFTDNLLMSGRINKYVTESWGYTAAKWGATELSGYMEPIPEFVLSKAVQIKEKLPEVKLYVHHLNQPKLDPFLIAAFGNEVYFVEVWDEPKFEGRLTR